MATVTVTNTITDDSGQPVKGAQVLISLVTAATTQPGYTTSSTIEGTLVVYTDATGTWSANLTPNSSITPANTYYRVTENNYWQSTIVVPASGGPYQISAVLSTPPPTPSAPGITGVQVAVSGAVAGVRPEFNLIPGSGVAITATDNPANQRVDVTVSSSGAVTSVNGQTGAVTLTAANVGAVATTGAETIAGVKTFSSAPVVPAAAFPESAISGLSTDLGNRTLYRGAWAASTAYAVNDLATIGGELLVCKTAHTSGTTFSLTNWTCLTAPVGRYNVVLYGADPTGVADSTIAINAAVTAGYNAGVAAGTYQAVIYFPPGKYLLGGATTTGSPTFGNAQIPLPVVATTGQKFTLAFVGGMPDNAGLWHWQQTTAQTGGVTLLSTLVGTNDVTNGEASVIGGPTPAQGYGQAAALFSNLLFVIAGVQIVVPNDPHACGLDLAGVAEMHIVNASVKANATPATVTAATQSWQFGVRAPDNNNNDYSVIDQYTCEGMNYGLIANEHLIANVVACIYCVAAVEAGRGSDTSHGSKIRYLSAESCQVGLGGVLGSFPIKIDVDLLDWEGGSGGFASFCVVNDGPGRLFGTVGVTTIGVTTHLAAGTGGYDINGAANLRVYDMGRQAGNAGALAAPTSGVATLNPFFRDAWANLSVTGGSITSVVVDSQTLAGAPTVVFVPTNKSITVTYTGTLTWTWTLQ